MQHEFVIIWKCKRCGEEHTRGGSMFLGQDCKGDAYKMTVTGKDCKRNMGEKE